MAYTDAGLRSEGYRPPWPDGEDRLRDADTLDERTALYSAMRDWFAHAKGRVTHAQVQQALDHEHAKIHPTFERKRRDDFEKAQQWHWYYPLEEKPFRALHGPNTPFTRPKDLHYPRPFYVLKPPKISRLGLVPDELHSPVSPPTQPRAGADASWVYQNRIALGFGLGAALLVVVLVVE